MPDAGSFKDQPTVVQATPLDAKIEVHKAQLKKLHEQVRETEKNVRLWTELKSTEATDKEDAELFQKKLEKFERFLHEVLERHVDLESLLSKVESEVSLANFEVSLERFTNRLTRNGERIVEDIGRTQPKATTPSVQVNQVNPGM